MQFITDRCTKDYTNAKGYYNYTDLNRVESAVQSICQALGQQGVDLALTTKTDWALGGSYPDNWPTVSQMQRYLSNVERIRSHFGINVALPTTITNLTYDGANAIEQVLEIAWQSLFGAQTNEEEHTDE